MKKQLFLMLGLVFGAIANTQANENIRLNQLGYYPESPKVFIVANSDASSFELQTLDGKKVFESTLSQETFWAPSGEKVKTGNFSAFSKEGSYKIVLNNKEESYLFDIKKHAYEPAALGSVKAFYLQRMSMPLEEKYAGVYKRPSGHPDTACYFHPSSGYNQGKKASPGGWYDAGDYNKYVVNAGITLGFLLQTNELYPSWMADGIINIPESGNGKNDLLDEIKYELDWMFTMQDTDGGVFFKLTNLSFDPFEMPEKTVEKRFFVGKSTTSALCFVASLSQAARVFASDADYSKKLLRAAENAWKWAVTHPNVPYKNPSDVFTGEYGDNNFDEEFFWAASELFITTNDQQYYAALKKYIQPFRFEQGDNWRFFLGELAYFSLSQSNVLKAEEKKEFQNAIVNSADSMLNVLAKVPYRIPMEKFTWGSNSDICDGAAIFANAYKINREKKYLAAAMETMDYLFGKNATGYSYLTGFGKKPVMHIHHRISAADSIEAPVPGLLSGGPNGDHPDEGDKPWNVKYTLREPARSFLDDSKSYGSNEIAINWNAPLFFVLSVLENEGK